MPSRGRASISQICVSGNLEVEMKMQSLAASSFWCSERCATVPEVASYSSEGDSLAQKGAGRVHFG